MRDLERMAVRDMLEFACDFGLDDGTNRNYMRRMPNKVSGAKVEGLCRFMRQVLSLLLSSRSSTCRHFAHGLINKFDTLDTQKYSYKEAWKMVGIQMQKKVSRLVDDKGEPNDAPILLCEHDSSVS